MEKKFCVCFRLSFYGNTIHEHVTTDTIGSSFAREIIDSLLLKIESLDQKNYFRSLLTLSFSNHDIQKRCFCSVFHLNENCEMKGAGKTIEYEVGNILFSERSKILEKIYSPSPV
jgi:hypothetical protein